MNSGYDPYGLDGRRRAVHEHLERYRKMRAAGRMDRAVEELRTATRLADESVEHTIEVAKTILTRIEDLCRSEADEPAESDGMKRDLSD